MTLKVSQLSVELSGRTLLETPGFEAYPGELLAIAGPNGAGKTTLLKAIAGLIAYSGQVHWQAEDLGAVSAAKRARMLAYLPQGHSIHWPITAREAVTIGRAPYSSSLTRLSKEDEAAIEAALKAVDAAAFADRPATELSGGERARIMLARALAVEAPLLLADEPVAALDPAHQLSVMSILAGQAKRGRLIICVSHDLLLASRFADRLLILHDGRIAGLGTPADILSGDMFERVFGVRAKSLSDQGRSIMIPWETIDGR